MKLFKILMFIWISVIYLFFINVYAPNLIDLTSSNLENQDAYSNGLHQKLSFGDSVSVSVTRNRWYGKIIESENNYIIYFFYFIRINFVEKGFPFIHIHIIFFVILSLLFLKGGKQKNEKVD